MAQETWGLPMLSGFWARDRAVWCWSWTLSKASFLLHLANALGLTDALSLVIIAVAAVAGHNWTVFLKPKAVSGSGATTSGAVIGLAIQFQVLRIILLLVTLVWLALFLLRYVSLASIKVAGNFSHFDGGIFGAVPIGHHVHRIVYFYCFSA